LAADKFSIKADRENCYKHRGNFNIEGAVGMREGAVSFALTAILILGSFSLIVTILPENVRASTLYVGGSGPGNYTTIQEGVDAAKPGDTVFVYAGTYPEDVEIPIPLSLVGEDANTTIIDIPGPGSNIWVTSDWVNITGFNLTKMLPGSGNNYGILLDYADYCSISHNIIFRNVMDGILLTESDNNVVADNLIMENRVGIGIGMSDYNIITSNRFFRNGAQVNVVGSQYNVIRFNTVTSDGPVAGGVGLLYSDNNLVVGNNFTNMFGGVSLHGSNNVTIVSNSFTQTIYGVSLSVSRLNVLRDNVMVENGILFQLGDVVEWSSNLIDTSNTVNGRPVYYWKNATGGTVPSGAGQVILANCTNVVVENQNISNGSEGVTLGHSYNNTIRNNNVSSHHYSGIRTYESGHNVVENNTAFGNENGIYIEESANNSVSNNTVLGNGAGLLLHNARENTFIHNEVRSNLNGMITDGALFNRITNNTFSNNFDGISFDRSYFNIINNNTITGHSVGVYLTYRDNMVYHNSFVDNMVQAVEPGFFGINIWDNGYPSGGNYWSDYNGTDVMMGPRQDIPGKDGIGDTPYDVPTVGQDRYPLLYPMKFARPQPPILKYAILSGAGYRDVVVGWDISPDDGGGLNSIVGYDIYRNTSYDPFYSGYQFLASVPSGSAQFVDSQAGEGDPNNHFYQVCAVDSGGNSTCAERQAGKFTRLVLEGPNLVSIPLVQSDESIEEVLQTVRFDKAWTYDAFQNEWASYMTFKPYRGELKTTNNKMGVWINVTQASNLTVAGIVPWMTSIELLSGWNLVGFPSFDTNHSVGEFKNDTSAPRVEGFDSSSTPYFLRVLSDVDKLETGYGYWVYVEADTTWSISNF
jgi:parallel beta-helix repeat protein